MTVIALCRVYTSFILLALLCVCVRVCMCVMTGFGPEVEMCYLKCDYFGDEQ